MMAEVMSQGHWAGKEQGWKSHSGLAQSQGARGPQGGFESVRKEPHSPNESSLANLSIDEWPGGGAGWKCLQSKAEGWQEDWMSPG